MLQAAGLPTGERAHCSPSRSEYSRQQLLELRLQATRMAVSLKSAGDEELVRAAITSSDHRHRVAAAFALGMGQRHDESLLMLMEDQHPLVVQAAREAATHICAVKFKQPAADFGPFPGADAANRTDSAALWRLYFDKQVARQVQQSAGTTAKSPASGPENRKAEPGITPIGFVSHGGGEGPPRAGEAGATVKNTVREISHDDESIPGMRIRRITVTAAPGR